MASWRSTRSSLRKTSWTRSGTSAPTRTRDERKWRNWRPWVLSRSVTKARRGSLLNSSGSKGVNPGLLERLGMAEGHWHVNYFSERPDGPDPAREVLVVAVLPTCVGKIDV